MNVTPEIAKHLTDWAGFLGFRHTDVFKQFIKRPERVVCFFTGNQFGKNASVVYSYILRIMGLHPVEKKNLRPDNPIRTIRFASQILPTDNAGGEVKNTQYPALKKFLPPSWIKKDIVVRNPVITIKDPQGGPDVYIEFVSYGQEVQNVAGVARWSVWLDESSPRDFYEEQVSRILAADGDMIYTLTPADFLGWEFEELYERAHVYIRTPAIRSWLKERYKKDVPEMEEAPGGEDIAVIQAATDDNPTLKPSAINDIFALIKEQDIIDIRRYGIFRQVSGLVHKEFNPQVHVISGDKYFRDGIPHDWVHVRGIDYHERNAWACGWLALSNTNECFVYNEFNPSPERMVTLQIAQEIAHRSKDYKFPLNLIDALAAKKQPNTGFSALEDFNRIFWELRREGIGTGGYWQTWDTKSTAGRERVRERLVNSSFAGKPFNNRTTRNGRDIYLPTIWFLDNCHETIQSFKSWRHEEWASRDQLLVKDIKDTTQQRHSHFPMVIECTMKHPGFNSGRYAGQLVPSRPGVHKEYFGARA